MQPRFITKKVVVSFASILLMIFGVLLFWYFVATPPSSEQFLSAQPIQAETTIEMGEWIPELPVRLVIPAIEVDAVVQLVGLDENGSGAMGVPDNFTDVGWYKDGVRPGMRGSAVIAGHYNGKNTPQAVFYDLHTLKIGDEVVVMSAERIEDIYFVVKIETYDYDAPTTDVFISTDGRKRLNLITCGGDWIPESKLYNKRTVVFTELMTDIE